MADTDTALVLRMEASLAKFEKQMARARQVGSESANQLEKRFSNANRALSASAEKSAQVIGREMERLRTKYDPVYAASRRYEAQLDELNRAHRLGAITAKQHEAALETLNAEYQRGAGAVVAMRGSVAQVTTGLTAMQAGAVRTSSGLNGMRGGIQNVSYQVADFAVQVSNGTAASVALGQQLPQLLGGFGMMGAVLGAVVAVGAPLISMMMKTEDGAKEMKKSLDELRDAVRAYRDAAADARIPTAELAERYGKASEKAREFLRALREISEVQARESVDDVFSRLADSFGELPDGAATSLGPVGEEAKVLLDRLDAIESSLRGSILQVDKRNALSGELIEVRDALGGISGEVAVIRRISDELDIGTEAAARIAAALAALDTAEGGTAQADAARNMLAALEAALGPYESMNDEARALYENVRTAGEEAANLVGAAHSGAAAIASTADEAGRLADELSRALGNLARLQTGASRSLEESEIRLKYRNDPVALAGALAELGARDDYRTAMSGATTMEDRVAAEEQLQSIIDTAKAIALNDQELAEWRKEVAKAAGSSGGAKTLNETLRQAEQIFDQTRTKAEEYAIALRELEEAYAATNGFEGLGGQETYDRALQKLKEQFGELPGLARDASNAVRSAFDGLFDDPARALENLAKQLAQMAIYQGLASAMPSVFGAGGIVPLVKNAKGGVYSGAGINAYSGKVVDSPTIFPFAKGAGLMGEAGPEAIMPLTRGVNGKLGVEAQGAGARQIVNISTEPGLAVERRRARGPKGEQMVEVMVRKTLASGRADGVMRGRFGAQPQGKKR